MRNWNFLLTVFFKKHRMRLWNIDWAWERRETRITSTSIIFFSFFSFIFFSFFSFMFFTLIILTFLSKHKILKIKEFQLKYLKFLEFKISQNFKFLHSNTLLVMIIKYLHSNKEKEKGIANFIIFLGIELTIVYILETCPKGYWWRKTEVQGKTHFTFKLTMWNPCKSWWLGPQLRHRKWTPFCLKRRSTRP